MTKSTLEAEAILKRAAPLTWRGARPKAATTAPMTLSSATSSAATNCKCGLSRSMWSTCH
jgi:hypothetical protein